MSTANAEDPGCCQQPLATYEGGHVARGGIMRRDGSQCCVTRDSRYKCEGVLILMSIEGVKALRSVTYTHSYLCSKCGAETTRQITKRR